MAGIYFVTGRLKSLPMSASSFELNVSKVRADITESQTDFVAVEEPLEIRLGYDTPNGRTSSSISITMRTPGDDHALALGFLRSEAIVQSKADIASVEHCGPEAPDSGNRNIVRVDLAVGVSVDLGKLQRHFYTTSSCGVCGKSSLDALHLSGASALPADDVQFSHRMLTALPDALRARQQTFDSTGGLHAAAIFNTQGEILICHEDVGRHNAVDKVIGSLLMNDALPASDNGLIVSGRTSFELMQKTVMAGIPLLAAVSAPSSLAVQLAKEFNVTLIGFLRGENFNIYSGGERLL